MDEKNKIIKDFAGLKAAFYSNSSNESHNYKVVENKEMKNNTRKKEIFNRTDNDKYNEYGNLNYYFNIAYFEDCFSYKFKDELIDKKDKNEIILKSKFDSSTINSIPYKPLESCKEFTLETVYPGLLHGTGYLHETGLAENEIKQGFFLDYVTGLPIIAGSTVKGVIKSIFEKFSDSVCDALEINSSQTGNLIKYIFGADDLDSSSTCVFFDAIPLDDELFELDYITPHTSEIKNPIPLLMLKVKPGVRYRFSFDLSKCLFLEKIKKTEDDLLQLFKEILIEFGIGAKRNVGFGIMKGINDGN